MCDQYYGNEGYDSQFCGDHDYEDFTAKTDCCACKEGFTPPGKWIKHNICLFNQIQYIVESNNKSVSFMSINRM